MYSKKYRLVGIFTNRESDLHDSIIGKICYLGFFRVGERGWFLCDQESGFDPVHRIHTSEVKDVKYEENGQVIVNTRNTEYVFDLEE